MKYELIKEGSLFRIKSLKDFRGVKKGDLGGLVEGKHNLSQEGACWIYDNAQVIGGARVSENAKVFDNAKVFGYAEVFENAKVSENAEVFENAKVFDNAEVSGYAKVFDNARVFDNAKVFDNAQATKEVITFGNAFDYDITVTDNHIKIGCQQHLKSEWLHFTDEEIIKMDGKKALQFWRLFKPLAEQMNLFN